MNPQNPPLLKWWAFPNKRYKSFIKISLNDGMTSFGVKTTLPKFSLKIDDFVGG